MIFLIHYLNVNVMLSNMTVLMIFAVFDPSPLTLWINLQFLVLIPNITRLS